MGEAFVEVGASAPSALIGPLPGDAPDAGPLSLGLPAGDGTRAGAMPAFELVVTCSEGTTTVAVCGELDVEAAPMLARSLDSFLGSGFAIDLDRMSFVDAAGLRAFVPSIRRFAARGERLVVRRPSPFTLAILDVSGLAPALAIEH